MRKAALHNLGCKVNSYETEAMQQMLEEAGYEIVPFQEGADVYVINTCSVTNIADRKSRQMLHKARKMNPDAVVVAVGCYVQAAGEELKKDEAIDIVIGNNKKTELVEILKAWFEMQAGETENSEAEDSEAADSEAVNSGASDSEVVNSGAADSGTSDSGASDSGAVDSGVEDSEAADSEAVDSGVADSRAADSGTAHSGVMHIAEASHIIDIGKTSEYERLSIKKIADHTRAFIKIQDGCNQFCSYCIIPYTRGRVRSREPEEILEEVRCLADAGYREIVLTGIHLSSYGVDFPEERNLNLLRLIVQLDAVSGIERIRLGSLEPRIITDEFARTLSSLSTFCPHFHLSLQSGCDDTLKRMNRRYTTEEYASRCELLRKYFKNPAITTDVIVGFPGESREEFETTKAYLERIHFYEMHVFKYSRRKGTRADAMENQIPEQVKAERSDILLELTERMSREYRESFIGETKEVLMEEQITVDGTDYITGYTKEYIRVAGLWDEALKGRMVTGLLGGFLTDEIMLFSREI